MTSSINRFLRRACEQLPSRFIKRCQQQEFASKAIWARRCMMGAVIGGVSTAAMHYSGRWYSAQCAKNNAAKLIQEHADLLHNLQAQWHDIANNDRWKGSSLLDLKMKSLQKEGKLSATERQKILEEALTQVVCKKSSEFFPLLELALKQFVLFDKEHYDRDSAFQSILEAMDSSSSYNQQRYLVNLLTTVYYNSPRDQGQKEVLSAVFPLISKRADSEDPVNSLSDLIISVGKGIGENKIFLMCQDASAIEGIEWKKALQTAIFQCAGKDPDNKERTIYGMVRSLLEGLSTQEAQKVSWQLLDDSIKTENLGAARSVFDALIHHFLHHTKEGALQAQNLCLTLMQSRMTTQVGKQAIAHIIPTLFYQANLPVYCVYVDPASIQPLIRNLWIEGVQPHAPLILKDFLAGFEKSPPKWSSWFDQKEADYSPWVETIIEHELDKKRTQYIPSILDAHAQCEFKKLLPRIWEDPKAMELLLQARCSESPNFRYLALLEAAKRGQSHLLETVEKWGVVPYAQEAMIKHMAIEHGFPEFIDRMQQVQLPAKECWTECVRRSQDLSLVHNQQCAVIFQTTEKGDSRGAFSDSREVQVIAYQLQQRGLTPLFLEVESVEALSASSNTLLSQGNQVPFIQIRGHGTSESIGLGSESLTAKSTSFHKLIEKLPSKTTLVLDSCSTGKGPDSLAKEISSWNPLIMVIAPVDDSRSSATSVTPLQDSFRVNMYRKEDNSNLTAVFQSGERVTKN